MVVSTALEPVPETMLWNLHHRAAEARRPDRVLDDPVAIDLLDRLGPAVEERFGPANPLLAQAQALRARRFDLEVERFLAVEPAATVVALGEGLETQFWRVDNGRVRWLSVDLPEPLALGAELLPTNSRRRLLPTSVLDPDWADEAGPGPVLVSAQGLLMYLGPEEARGVIATAVHAADLIVFDTVPPWFSARTQRGMRTARGYVAPPMPWGVGGREERALAATPGVARLRRLVMPRGRGPLFGAVLPLFRGRAPRPLRYLAPWSFYRAEPDPDESAGRRAG